MRFAAILACILALVARTSAQDYYKVLTDDNFEHVTQAATGQTSGAWCGGRVGGLEAWEGRERPEGGVWRREGGGVGRGGSGGVASSR